MKKSIISLSNGIVWSNICKNRASSISIMSAALIASLLLSILCSFFYNMWLYDVESVVLEEGDWQARIVGTVSEEELELIRSFGNITKAVAHEEDAEKVSKQVQISEETGHEVPVVDLYFRNPRTIYSDMTLLSQKLGLESGRMTFNYQLLSMYFIRIPGDEKPRMILPLYTAVMILASFSLIIVIHNSFAVSMNAKIHQLGILSSVGATPRQIRTSLIQEADVLCTLPVLLGNLAGICVGYGFIHMMNIIAAGQTGRHEGTFRYPPLIFVFAVFISMLTVLVSAWIPARRLAEMTPLSAIHGGEEMQLRKKKSSPVLFWLFGIEGELAGNALKAQKKALRTSSISLTLAFLSFTVMLCFFKLSDISTSYTYFARYQDVWDVMAVVKDVRIEDMEWIEDLQTTVREEGEASCAVYQKAVATAQVHASQISKEVEALGGLERLAGQNASGKYYLIQAPLIILDDAGFAEYCEQIGMTPRSDGAIVINYIWDSVNSNFRYRDYVPYLTGERDSTDLRVGGPDVISGQKNETEIVSDGGVLEIPILGYTDKEPLLREEYDDYTLVHVIPLSLWKDISSEIRQGVNVESNAYVRILTDRTGAGYTTDYDEKMLLQLNRMEEVTTQILGQKYEVETENRMQEKISNGRIIAGYQFMIGVFSLLLATIGIANVFSYTMGFMRVRRRECARYLSVGMTPEGLKKMFRIEMLVIAGRPVLITVPLTVVAISAMIRASYLNPAEFWRQAPYVPIAVFIAAVYGFVATAYAIGGRKILKDNLVDALRNETVM